MQDRDAKPERGRKGGRGISQQHCGRKVTLLCNCACIILLQHLLPKLICRSDWAPKVKSYASLLSFNMHRRWSFWKQAYEIPKERKKPWKLCIFPRTIKHRSDICLHVGVLLLTSPELQCVVSSFELFGNFPPDTLCQCHRHLNILALSAFWTIDTTSLHGLCSPPCAQLCSIDGSNSCVWKYQVGTMIAS